MEPRSERNRARSDRHRWVTETHRSKDGSYKYERTTCGDCGVHVWRRLDGRWIYTRDGKDSTRDRGCQLALVIPPRELRPIFAAGPERQVSA